MVDAMVLTFKDSDPMVRPDGPGDMGHVGRWRPPRYSARAAYPLM